MTLPRTTFVRRYLLVMSVLTLAAVLASLALRSGVRARSGTGILPEIDLANTPLGHIDGFRLTDQSGTEFSSESLAGKVYVADFIFTSCAGICPAMTGAMAALQREFADDDRVRFLSITVDPETDTPERLAEYAAKFGADTARWKFLTGPIEVVDDLARNQFLLGFGGEPVNHSSRFVLVDGKGDIRGFFDGTDPVSVEELRTRIAELAQTESTQD